MSEESQRFLEEIVEKASRLTAHEMVENHDAALTAILAGHGNRAWRDGEPLGGTIWQPRVRWHIDSSTAHVFVDVSGLNPDGVTLEAGNRGLELTFRRVRERVLDGGEFHTHEEVSQRSVNLGIEIDPTSVSADVEDGIMHIRCKRDSANQHDVSINWNDHS